MRKLIIVLNLAFLLIGTNAYGEISISKKQFDNLDVIHQELKKVDANFIGLAGSQSKLKVYGMGESQAQEVIEGLDLDMLIQQKETAKQEAEDTKEVEKLLKLLIKKDIKDEIKKIQAEEKAVNRALLYMEDEYQKKYGWIPPLIEKVKEFIREVKL